MYFWTAWTTLFKLACERGGKLKSFYLTKLRAWAYNDGMMKELTREDIIQLMRALADERGSQTAAAKEIGITLAYFNDVIQGRKDPGPSILQHFGVEKTYKKK